MPIRNKHLANIITLSRIFGIGFVFLLVPFSSTFWQTWTIVIYTAICLTDFLDGYIARKMRIVSDFGKILDPLADKILVLVFLPLLQIHAITAFPVFIILSREFVIMAMRVMSAKNGLIVPARFSGKLKTGLTLPVCGILLARIPVPVSPHIPLLLQPLHSVILWVSHWPGWAFEGLIWSMVAVTLWSLIDYLKDYVWNQALHKAHGREDKAKQRLKMWIPNTITMLNLLCGVFASIYAFNGNFHLAVLLVILGTLLDALDGRLARKLDAFSKFGAKLDSKADYTNFGIAPAVVIFCLLSTHFEWYVGFIVGAVYYASVHYRLVRFDKGGHSHYFEGLPSPVGAGLVVLAAISGYLSQPAIFIPIVIGLAALMASRISYLHLDIFGRKKFAKFLSIPTVTFLTLTILHLLKLDIATNIYAYEMLFLVVSMYVVAAPFFKKYSPQ